MHRQLRALTILDGLIQNAGSRFQRAFVDEPLLERLRVCGTSDLVDPQVRDRCKTLFAEWTQYKKTPGLERIAGLYKVHLLLGFLNDLLTLPGTSTSEADSETRNVESLTRDRKRSLRG